MKLNYVSSSTADQSAITELACDWSMTIASSAIWNLPQQQASNKIPTKYKIPEIVNSSECRA
jgi:hypothetical protein